MLQAFSFDVPEEGFSEPGLLIVKVNDPILEAAFTFGEDVYFSPSKKQVKMQGEMALPCGNPFLGLKF
eukprot:3113206-Heterocapsa_arctica.AAC.1